METKVKKTKKGAKESTIPITPEQLHEEIRKRASEIFLKRGGASGDALTDWLQAEKEIREKYNISYD